MEIIFTIHPNGAAVHPYEPIPPNHTNHYKWWEEMTTKINKIATAPDTCPSNTKSGRDNVKISIPPKKLLEAKKKPYWDENLTIGPLYTNLVTKSCLDDCKALCVTKFMERHEKSDVGELIEYLIPNPHYVLRTVRHGGCAAEPHCIGNNSRTRNSAFGLCSHNGPAHRHPGRSRNLGEGQGHREPPGDRPEVDRHVETHVHQ